MDGNIEITPELIEEWKARDERIAAIALADDVRDEIEKSKAWKILLTVSEQQAKEALEELAQVSPSDIKRIIELQAKIFRARFIGKTLDRVIATGRAAEQSLAAE